MEKDCELRIANCEFEERSDCRPNSNFAIRNSKFFFAAAFYLLFPCLLLAQNTLRVDVNLVNVFATVKNERGEFVTGLTRDDFRVYEDDELQEIRVFENQDRVASSIGILMDTSGSMVDILPYMKTGI